MDYNADTLTPEVMRQLIETVLSQAKKGKGTGPKCLTAYQILSRLPDDARAYLILSKGVPGLGCGSNSSAAQYVAYTAANMPGVAVDYMDTGGVQFLMDGVVVTPSGEVCGLYRLA